MLLCNWQFPVLEYVAEKSGNYVLLIPLDEQAKQHSDWEMQGCFILKSIYIFI